jgi:hypothetical protein
VLDNETDENGNSPANYVLTDDDTKYDLFTSGEGTTELVLENSMDVAENDSATMVMDFDLRKAIGYDSIVRYHFVEKADLESAVRVVDKDEAGNIVGTYEEMAPTNSDMIIVYAYRAGEFDQTETTTSTDGIAFQGAVASSKVDTTATNNYQLSFLEPGDYDLEFASYSLNPTTNRFEFGGLLESSVIIGADTVDVITVNGRSTTNVSAAITGLLLP